MASQATWTSNAAFQAAGQEQDDLILEIAPRFTLNAEGARLQLNGTAVLNTVTYSRSAQDNAFRPEVDFTARLEAVERRFFVEAGLRATQVLQDPFRARADGASSFNSATATQARVAPYLQGAFSPTMRYLARSDNTWTHQSDAISTASAAVADIYLGRHLVEIERTPVPFGATLQFERTDTRYEDSLQPTLYTDIARIIGNYAVSPEVVLALRGGYERNNYTTADNEGAIVGAGATWRPTERTELSGLYEDRFFGSGWRMVFSHRMPRLGWNITSSRDVGSFAQSLLELPATTNVAALLDRILTTRFPDPTERGRAVQDVIDRQGLPSATSRAATLYGQRLSLIASQNATVTLLGVRNSLAFGVFRLRTEELLDASAFPIIGSARENNTQRGATVTLSHLLTALTSLNATAVWSNVRGLGVASGETSRQNMYRVQATRRLAPRTNGFIGMRYQEFDSSVESNATEGAVFLGLQHSF